ncbi:MAG: hypothetical protein CVU38_11960, partial [Chloroflexi bacterium HGW-Chloroflexi-1]
MINKRMLLTVLAAGVVLLALADPIEGQATDRSAEPLQTTVTLYAVADATLKSSNPNQNFGGGSLLEVSYAAGNEAVFLVRFDLSTIPAEATIDSAVLGHYLQETTGASPVSVGAFYVTSAWNEYTVTWNTAPSWATTGLSWGLDSITGRYYELGVASWARAWHTGDNNGLAVRGPYSPDTPLYGRWFESRHVGANPPR